MTRLDDLLARAHDLRVRDDHAQRYVAELGRWARPSTEPRRSRLPWFAGGFALAAAAAAIAVLVLRPAPERGEAIRLGERVAILAAPGTQYQVVAADAAHTEVLVERGTITARLWPGHSPHRLALRGAGVEAVATGTVFALEVDPHGAHVHVHEGTVAVARGDERAQVTAGAAWPAGTPYRGRRAGEQLLALAAPPPVPPEEASVVDAAVAIAPAIDAGIAVAPPDAAASTVMTDAGASRVTPPRTAETIVDAGAAPSLTDRYRHARLLRGQGKLDAAVAECLAIADAKDATWSPIALVEAARIELGPRASPERAIDLAERFAREWPSHQLAPEARELRCRALRQLGRADECKAP